MIRPPGCWLLWLCEAALIRGLWPKAADRVRRHLPAKLSQWESATWWWMWMMIAVTSSFDSELMSLYMFIYIIYIYIITYIYMYIQTLYTSGFSHCHPYHPHHSTYIYRHHYFDSWKMNWYDGVPCAVQAWCRGPAWRCRAGSGRNLHLFGRRLSDSAMRSVLCLRADPGAIKGFNGGLMGFNGGLMGFNGGLMVV